MSECRRWQPNQAPSDTVGSRTRSRLPVLVASSEATVPRRRIKQTKLASTSASGLASSASSSSSAVATSLAGSIPGVATTTASIAGVSSLSLAPSALDPGLRPRRAGRIDEVPLEENDDDDEAGATEAFHDLGRPQFESPEGENQQFPSRSDSFQVDRAHSSRTGPLGTVDTVEDQMAEAEQLAKEVQDLQLAKQLSLVEQEEVQAETNRRHEELRRVREEDNEWKDKTGASGAQHSNAEVCRAGERSETTDEGGREATRREEAATRGP